MDSLDLEGREVRDLETNEICGEGSPSIPPVSSGNVIKNNILNSSPEKRKPGRPKGQPKTGGKIKGTPTRNEKFLTDKLRNMYGKDFDPIMRAAEMAVEIHSIAIETREMADMVQAVNCWDKIAQYITPKLKAIEVRGDTATRQIRDVTINVVSTSDNNGIEQAAQSLIKDIN